MSDKTTLDGQVAVVTGGARGIGRGISKELARLGAKVYVNYSRSGDVADELVRTITQDGGDAEALKFDVSDSQSVEEALKDVLASSSRIDILVNNAGIALDSLIVRSKIEDWQRTIDVNLSGVFYCSRAVSRTMMKARYGRIINISSVIGETGNAGQTAYSASKAGILGLTKSLAKELAGRGVTVNAITPGYIETDMTQALADNVKQEILKEIPLNSFGTPDDVASVVAFYCSEGARYLTGTVLGVNGGMYM